MPPPLSDREPLDPADPADRAVPSEPAEPVGVRIGELSRRVGVSTELLRAWERRYRLLQPARSPKGYRLYTEQDERRVRLMQDQLTHGLSAAEAAVAARQAPAGATPVATVPDGDDESDAAMRYYRALEEALDAYDEPAAQLVFDAMLRRLTVTTVLRDVVMPYLAQLGARWAAGRVDIAQEHFASNLIRGRLAALALGWGDGVGPRAVLACPKGELHDLPLMVFGIALNRCGWRITFLGNNTPVTDLENAVRHLRPEVVVLAATTPAPFLAAAEDLTRLGATASVVLAGAGATPEAVRAAGAVALAGDPVTEAQRLRAPRRPEPAVTR